MKRCIGAAIVLLCCLWFGAERIAWAEARPAATGGAVAGPAVACPGTAELLPRLRALLNAGTDEVGIDGCAPARFPRPGWAVAAWTAKKSSLSEGKPLESTAHLLAVDAADRKLVGRAEPEQTNVNFQYGAPRTADFDGDGIDEVLWELTDTTGGRIDEQLRIFRLSDGALTPALELTTKYEYDEDAMDEPDPARAVSYDAKTAIGAPDGKGARSLVVTGKLKAGKRANRDRIGQFVVQRAVFRLQNGRFIRGARNLEPETR